jgi:hypothetical protein
MDPTWQNTSPGYGESICIHIQVFQEPNIFLQKNPKCWLDEHPHAFYSDAYGRFLFFNIILRSIEETQKHEKIMYEPT